MAHANATLTPGGRLKLARLVVEKGWTLARAAERFSVAITTARRWADRYRQVEAAGRVPTARHEWTGRRDRSAAHAAGPAGPNDGSSGCGSPAGGGRPGSPTTWG